MAPLFVNNYKPDSGQKVSTTDPWNFILPVPESIETNRLKLVPFVPSIHAEPWHAARLQNPNFMQYVGVNLNTVEEIIDVYRTLSYEDPHNLLFAIIDTPGAAANDGSGGAVADGTMAGVIGALKCEPENLKLELGPVIVFPAFQGTHVSKHAIGAMLKYWLDVPSQGGMGFRRVSWTSNPANGASVGVAEKMGFKKEGINRWAWVVPEGRPGMDVDSERGARKGANQVVLSLCWDDWENGVREKVLKLMET